MEARDQKVFIAGCAALAVAVHAGAAVDCPPFDNGWLFFGMGVTCVAAFMALPLLGARLLERLHASK
jgi:hypothetical protein